MTTLEVLKAARAKIADRKNWTRGAYARDDSGCEVPETDSRACKFCAVGALRAVNMWPEEGAFDALHASVHELGFGRYVTEANDIPMTRGGAGHRGILAAYDHAIAKLEPSA